MAREIPLQEIHSKVQALKREAEGLMAVGEAFPALYRNTARIIASIKMLELNTSDLVDSGQGQDHKGEGGHT
ncbi:MAG: hypothetical protein JRH06_09660 [Deltaproteobacteria bacterium]|nr:hypothetical protein [Deltaproteobacteria bacterium]MBW2137810.1 hypothetical protein [Deltaproteobacteria bacterium]